VHPTIIRAVTYLLLAGICYAVAVFFTESQRAFVIVFAIGFGCGIAAEIYLWYRIYRITRQRLSRS
jgi:hypothetical protein